MSTTSCGKPACPIGQPLLADPPSWQQIQPLEDHPNGEMLVRHPSLDGFFGGCSMRWLLVFVMSAGLAWPTVARSDSPPGQFPATDNDAAWANLPRDNPPLPPWAKVLVGPLPKTTAKMLELDYFHREKNPLGPVLAANIRRVVAKSLGSKYGEAVAVADLKRAGVSQAHIDHPLTYPPAEWAARKFA